MRALHASFASITLTLVALVAPHPARACGGTFCDGAPAPPTPSGPMVMSVDQRGENILFVLDGKSVEAHIQIQYEGDAAHFAWVIPVRSIPAFSIGSEALFDRLLSATAPTYGYTLATSCKGNPPGSGAGGSAGGGAGGGPGGPSVVLSAAVGAYEIHVLSGGTAASVQQWLIDHGYAPSADAPPIFEQYLSEGYLFAALKLQPDAGVDRIHPIVIRVPGNEPCVPLRLTRVAAVEDMTVRTFFLADRRAVPTNFRHVTLNPLRLDWLAKGANYDDLVARAVDDPVADGHAFVTEYAGPSDIAALPLPPWDAAAFQGIAPEDVVEELKVQGLATCPSGVCTFAHPLLTPILHQFLPVPAGVSEGKFYGSLASFKDLIDLEAWDAAGFAGAFDERIVLPAVHATSVLDDHPYLTRMVTRISPAEMTEDPEFALRAGLPGIAPLHVASLVQPSCTCATMTLPDGRKVSLANGAWPAWGTDMPWAETVGDFSKESPITLVDAGPKIAAILAEHESLAGCAGFTSGGTAGGKGGSGHAGAIGAAGGPGSPYPNGQGGSPGAPDSADPATFRSSSDGRSDSPSCSIGHGGPRASWSCLALAIWAAARRRRPTRGSAAARRIR